MDQNNTLTIDQAVANMKHALDELIAPGKVYRACEFSLLILTQKALEADKLAIKVKELEEKLADKS